MSPVVVESGALDSGSAVAETDPVPKTLLVPLAPIEVELLRGYEDVCELFCEAMMEVVVCPDEIPVGPILEREEVIPVSVAFVWTDVGIDTDSVMEADMLTIPDWLLAVLAVGIGVFVNGYVAVSPVLELLTGPVDNGIDDDVDPSPEEDPAELVSRLLTPLPVVSGGDVVLGNPLDSDPAVPEAVLFVASVADAAVPRVVKFSVSVGDDEMLLGA